MSWREELQKATFRGVPFEVESDDATFGRRGEVHEYPQRDIPYVEDLGRRAREKTLIAFVIGDDYITKRDALIAAVEKAGPGELVHPYYGRMMVSITDGVRVTHTKDEGGMCRFQIPFIESGELNYPVAANAPGKQTLTAVDALETTCKADFTDSFSVDNLSDFAVQDAVSTFSGVLDTLDSGLTSVGGVLSDPLSALRDDLGSLVRNPAELANRVFGLFSKSEAVIDQVSGLSDVNSLNFLRAFSTLRLVNLFGNGSSSGSTPTRTAMAKNQVAINTLTRQALIAQTAGMISLMPLPVYDDASKLENELLTKIDDEAAISNDDTYLALKDLRTKVYADVTSRTQNAARIQVIQPKQVMPALVLAYDLYEDVSRDAEIIDRNKIRHAGFVPATSIKVLSA